MKYGIGTFSFNKRITIVKYRIEKEKLQEVVKTSLSIAEVCRKLDIRPAGGNYKTIKDNIGIYDIDISHFTGKGWNTGSKYRRINKIILLSLILIDGSSYQSNKLKIRLFNEGIKLRICESCKNTEWLGNPIKLELHHINGNSNDNRLENLQILCYNCHGCTTNYRGKNKIENSKISDEWLESIKKFRAIK